MAASMRKCIGCQVAWKMFPKNMHTTSHSACESGIKIISERPTIVQKIAALKRIQSENKQLFGPILKSQRIRQREIRRGMTQPKTDPIPIKTSPSISVDECGFSELPAEANYKLLKIDLTSIVGFPIINPWRSKILTEKITEPEEEISKSEQRIFPSVTKILNETMPASSRLALEKWKQNMIADMGVDAFQNYQREMLLNGKKLHESIAKKLSGQDPEVAPANYNHWKSLELIFPKLKEVILLEKPVRHKFLRYHGIVDCVAVYKNRIVVIDWKTSKKQKTSLASVYDSPLQVSAYAGALNFDQRYKFQVDSAVIILAYENGLPAHIHYLDKKLCVQYWRMWLLRLKTFWESVEVNK